MGRIPTNGITCLRCEKLKGQAKYYENTHPLFSSSKFEICKDCVKEYLGHPDTSGYRDRVIIVLSMLNKPFIELLWESRDRDFYKYITQVSSLPHYKDLSFVDSDFFKDKIVENVLDEEDDFIITKQMRMFWRGYTDDDIPILEMKFQNLIAVYECKTPVQETIYKTMATIQYMMETTKNPTDLQKLQKTLSDLMDDANIKPRQDTGDNGLSTWGEWIKKIEETEPIIDEREEFNDVDGIMKYINRWFVRPMQRIFGIHKDNEQMDDDLDDLVGKDEKTVT